MNKVASTAIEVSEWDDVVTETYKRPYSFQQQAGCRERGVFRFRVPAPQMIMNWTLYQKM